MTHGFSDADYRFMRRALRLSVLGRYGTHPNPRVGCVLVRQGRILGEGWHERAGGLHAEIAALSNAQASVHGATAYVTLEPCCHFGRTRPCVEALIAAGVSRVVAAMQDPNPVVAGRGIAELCQAGIDVELGLCREAAEKINAGYVCRLRHGRPYVRLKQAASLDGRVALASGASRWITGRISRTSVHRRRAESSAVLTGIGTVLHDDPQLNVRGIDTTRQPWRFVLDSQLRLPTTARVLRSSGGPVHVICTEHADRGREALLGEAGACIHRLKQDGDGRVDLEACVAALGTLEINDLWVEAGPRLARSLLAADLVDEWWLYFGPKILGDQAIPLVEGPALSPLSADEPRMSLGACRSGTDVLIRCARRK